MLEFRLALFVAIMWPSLEHPDRGIIGASYTMENFETKTQEDSDSEDMRHYDSVYVVIQHKTGNTPITFLNF
jgi:hypothetical protein